MGNEVDFTGELGMVYKSSSIKSFIDLFGMITDVIFKKSKKSIKFLEQKKKDMSQSQIRDPLKKLTKHLVKQKEQRNKIKKEDPI